MKSSLVLGPRTPAQAGTEPDRLTDIASHAPPGVASSPRRDSEAEGAPKEAGLNNLRGMTGPPRVRRGLWGPLQLLRGVTSPSVGRLVH